MLFLKTLLFSFCYYTKGFATGETFFIFANAYNRVFQKFRIFGKFNKKP